MPDMESRRLFLRPAVLALGMVAVVGIAVVISGLGDEESPVVTTSLTSRPPETSAPLRVVVPSTGFSTGPPESIPRTALAEAEWAREDEWAGTLRSPHGHGIMLAPGVVTGVYHEDGTVFATDMETGGQLWTTEVSDRRSAALFAIQDGGSVIAGGPGYIVSLDLATGEEVWRSTFDQSLRPADAITRDGRLYVTLDGTGGEASRVLSLDISTGQILWRSVLADTSDLVHPDQLRMVEGVVVVGVTTGVIGLDARSGSVIWISDFRRPSADPTVTPSPLLVEDGRVYTGDFSGQMVAFEVETGERVLKIEAAPGRVRALTVTDGELVFTDVDGVHAIDVADGSEVWSVALEEPCVAEIAQDGGIFVVGRDVVMAVGDRGDIDWRRPWGGAQTGLVVTDGAMVVSGANGLSFLDSANGEVERTIPLGSTTPMHVRQGRLVVSHSDGSLALYRLAGRGWASLPEPPITPRSAPRTVWDGSELIAYMEYTGSGSSDAPLVGTAFNPATSEWRVLPEPPLTGRYGFVVEMIGDEVLLFGGVTDSVREEETGAILNLGTGRWREMTQTDVANIGEGGRLAGVWTGDRLLVLGYFGDSRNLSLAGYDPTSDTWTELQAPPASATAGSVTWTDDRLILWGENDTGFSYDPASDRWDALASAPIKGRRGHTATWTGEEVVIFGGVDRAGNERADGAAYDPETREWRRIARGPLRARHDHHAVWSGSEILILGGTVGSNPVERSLKTGAAYDPMTDSWRGIPDLPVTLGQMTTAWVPDYGLIVWGSKGGFVLDPDRAR